MTRADRLVPTVLLAAALVAGGLLRVATVFTKPVFFHDESHSYQAATGHVGDAARITEGKQPPYGRWAPAGQWKRLLRPDDPMCFRRISRDALAYDVHPPAYYWLLHLSCLAFGTHYWTGTLLNAVLDCFTLFAVYRLARYATADRAAAAAAAFVWMVGAASLQVAVVEARMYSLLALVAVLFVDQLARFVHEPGKTSWGRLAGLAGLTAAGALTHHHFAIVAAGAVGWALVGRVTVARRRAVYAALAVAAGYLLLVAVHPFFFGTGWKHLSKAHLLTRTTFDLRARKTLDALSHLVVEARFGGKLPVAVVVAAAAIVPALYVLAWLTVRPRRRPAATPGTATPYAAPPDPAPVARYAVAVGAWVTAVTVGLYVGGVTPAHAMAHRYLAMAWPFVAVAVGILLARPGLRRAALAAACGVALLTGAADAFLQWRDLDADHPGAAEADRLIRGADRVVIDNVGRGHWPRPAWRVRDDARVMIAAPNDLLRRPARGQPDWRKELTPGTVYISPAQSAGDAREKLVQSFGKQHAVRHVGHLYGIGDVYVFDR